MHNAIKLYSSNQSTFQVPWFIISSTHTQKPTGREILIAPLKVGFCGTDWQIARGYRNDNATILGHEGVAEIVEIGSECDNYYIGEKVVFNPVDPHDRSLILGHTTQGLLQQYRCISQQELESGLIIPYKTDLPTIYAPLIEPLSTVIYGQSLVRKVTEQRAVAIFGAGTIGLLHAMYARMQGCSQIYIVHNRQERLEWIVEQGIVDSDSIFIFQTDTYKKILERTDGKGVDATYICTPRYSSISALDVALKCTSTSGCIDLVGGIADADRIHDFPKINLNDIRRSNHCGVPTEGIIRQVLTACGKHLYLTGHRGTSKSHLQLAMNILDDCRSAKSNDRSLDFIKLISHLIPFQSAPSTLNSLLNNHKNKVDNQDYIKIVIDFEFDQ
jgi:2-epi-valiolone-7-phosphate 1-reductase